MRVLITGASGFVGKYVVAEALRCGHQVRALVRSSASLEHTWRMWGNGQSDLQNSHLASRTTTDRDSALHPASHPSNLDIACVDLKTGAGLADALQDIDAVIHLAAAKSGDRATQFANTVTATQTLLDEMERAAVKRLIAISSFSVYDYLHQPQGALLEEHAPLERQPDHRDVYTQAKLQQEHLVRQFQTRCNGKVTVLRPGIIFGPGALWPCHLGIQLTDNICVQIGNAATLPLTYVENCADAIVKAVESDRAIGRIINVVDDDRPTQQEFIDFLHQLQAETISTQIHVPVTLGLSWKLMRHMARAAWMCDRLLGGRLPLPGVLSPARLHARFKPLDYSNHVAKTVLNWSPRYPLAESVARSLAHLNRYQLPARPSASSSPQPQRLTPEVSSTPTSISMRAT